MPCQIHIIPPPRGQPYLNKSEPRRFPDDGSGMITAVDNTDHTDCSSSHPHTILYDYGQGRFTHSTCLKGSACS